MVWYYSIPATSQSIGGPWCRRSGAPGPDGGHSRARTMTAIIYSLCLSVCSSVCPCAYRQHVFEEGVLEEVLATQTPAIASLLGNFDLPKDQRSTHLRVRIVDENLPQQDDGGCLRCREGGRRVDLGCEAERLQRSKIKDQI